MDGSLPNHCHLDNFTVLLYGITCKQITHNSETQWGDTESSPPNKLKLNWFLQLPRGHACMSNSEEPIGYYRISYYKFMSKIFQSRQILQTTTITKQIQPKSRVKVKTIYSSVNRLHEIIRQLLYPHYRKWILLRRNWPLLTNIIHCR